MPTADLNQRIKRIVGLTDDDVNHLSTVAATEDDLIYLIFDDSPNQIPLVTCHKLSIASNAPDPSWGAPRMTFASLATLSGNPIDYEEWERKKDAIIKQTVCKTFIIWAANVDDVVEEARYQELYNMYLSSVTEGSALNIVEKA
eukprot:10991001-Ditylum_brightwellii.AAC.1